jgi:mono/diheme cytochrome c family protein
LLVAKGQDMRALRPLMILVLLWPMAAMAQDRSFTLSAPAALEETGLLKFMLPRFSLKTGVRIAIARDQGAAALILTTDPRGTAVFAGPGGVWHLDSGPGPGAEHAARFADWLLSEVGQRTVTSFAPEGEALFTVDLATEAEEVAPEFTGDAEAGHRIALAHCGRCHTVDASNRMKSLGSTPSFAVLRTLPDWALRFTGFYLLNPHPAFTQIDGVTDPFDPGRPPPIAPLELTLDDLDAILAFVAVLEPANLGGPLVHQ